MRKNVVRKDKRVFLKIWLGIAVPILAVTIVALYLFLNFLLFNMEMLRGGYRVENISTELAMILSNTDLTDKAAVDKKFDLSGFHMIGILFDPDGREVARSDFYQYTDAADEVLAAKYQEMEQTILDLHAGADIIPNNQIHVFDYNFWYAEGPVWTPQGEYALYCAGMSATWPQYKDKLLAIGAGILAVMVILTLLIALSSYRIHRKQQAVEKAFSQKVNMLAHNLKTPMMVISGYSENLMAEIQTGKNIHYAEKIFENVNKMNDIVEEMLEFTRME